MRTVYVQKDFAAPVERVFGHLAEHENLETVFAPARIERVRDGTDGERNGVGSVRRISFWGALPFEETVITVVPGERIEYEITKGSPMRGHHGTMEFAPTGAGGTHLDYTVTFDSAVPGLAPVVAAALRRRIAAGLRDVEAALAA